MARRSRFVKPEIVRISLSNDDWIEVKKRLTVGETKATLRGVIGAGNIPKLEMVGTAEVMAYLVAWSLVDEHDKPVPISEGALDSLDVDDFEEIKAAIDKHKADVEAEREASKNLDGGATMSGSVSTYAVS